MNDQVLTYENNWESLSWLVDGKPTEPNDIKYVYVSGQLFKVKWRMEEVWYDDMGHSYSATSPHGYVKWLNVEVPLDQLIHAGNLVCVKEN